MRLTSANRAAALLLLVLAACHYKPEKNQVKGNWKYISVTKADSVFIEVRDNDMLMLGDSVFDYRIESVKKHMKGKWDYSDHTLHLHYSQPDTTRHFVVDLLSKYNMQFHEGDVIFKFSRVD